MAEGFPQYFVDHGGCHHPNNRMPFIAVIGPDNCHRSTGK